ncbi:hypothetical protein B0H19DRAFT_1246783 [Mycena capillaripes]|nr:hypothetical protein B0H19DRAFT_1246783 [Mycena capillaripes]
MADSLEWRGALQRTIMLAQLPGQELNPRSSKYPSGDLWKCILGLSVVADLKGTDNEDDTNTTRFVRIEHLGLSGVIFYSAPLRRVSILSNQTMDSEIDALLERNGVQVLYFPNMACTSFVIGQVMKAHLLADPAICPKPRLSGSGFSINSRAFETLGHALICGSSVPICDLSGQLKPTPQCAERVLKDRHRAKHAVRLLLAVRDRNAIRNTHRIGTPSSVPDKFGKSSVRSRREDAEDSTGEEYHDALDILRPPSPPALRSNAVILSFDGVNKLPLLPALRDHHRANPLSKTSADPQISEKRMKGLDPAAEKENNVFV